MVSEGTNDIPNNTYRTWKLSFTSHISKGYVTGVGFVKIVFWYISAQKSETWSGLSEINWLKLVISNISFSFSISCLGLNRPWVFLYPVSTIAVSGLIWSIIFYLVSKMVKIFKFGSTALKSLRILLFWNNRSIVYFCRWWGWGCRGSKKISFFVDVMNWQPLLFLLGMNGTGRQQMEIHLLKISTILLKCVVLWY